MALPRVEPPSTVVPNAVERFLEALRFLVRGEDLEALHQGQAGIDHDRELPEENGDVLGLDLATAAKGRQREFFALFLDGHGLNAFAPQRLLARVCLFSALRSPVTFSPAAFLPVNVNVGIGFSSSTGLTCQPATSLELSARGGCGCDRRSTAYQGMAAVDHVL